MTCRRETMKTKQNRFELDVGGSGIQRREEALANLCTADGFLFFLFQG